ncbi:putative transposase DNA-binding domain-containing protein, partial [Lipomyces kononenkoae]
ELGRGWAVCRTWSSGAEVHPEFQMPLDGLEEGDPDQPALKARRYRLHPTGEEQQILVRWIGAARWTFNECLRAIKDEGSLQKPWLKDTPYDIRDAAMDDLLKAFKAGAARYKKDKKVFEIRYRSRRNCFQESIVIHSKHWKHRRGKYAFLRRLNSGKKGETLPDALPHDSRLVRERLTGHFYLCVPGPLDVVEGPAGVGRVMSLDPGVRTFMTGYSPDGEVIELGKADIGHIYRLCHWLDDLQSRWSVQAITHKKRWRMKKAAAIIRRRIRNLVDDLHKRAAKYLCSSYNLVLLPKFESQQMTARAMMTWSHYRFQRRLLNKAREYPWCHVVLVSEAHTSKTCGQCGRLNNVGGSKFYRCSHCGFQCDRDINGARNILLRYCTKIARGESVMD